MRLNYILPSNQSRLRWFKTPSHSLLRHSTDTCCRLYSWQDVIKITLNFWGMLIDWPCSNEFMVNLKITMIKTAMLGSKSCFKKSFGWQRMTVCIFYQKYYIVLIYLVMSKLYHPPASPSVLPSLFYKKRVPVVRWLVSSTGALEGLSGHLAGQVPGWVAEWNTRFRTTTLPGCNVWIHSINRFLSITLRERRKIEVHPPCCSLLEGVKCSTQGVNV